MSVSAFVGGCFLGAFAGFLVGNHQGTPSFKFFCYGCGGAFYEESDHDSTLCNDLRAEREPGWRKS
jgi:hypothetical protein